MPSAERAANRRGESDLQREPQISRRLWSVGSSTDEMTMPTRNLVDCWVQDSHLALGADASNLELCRNLTVERVAP